MIPKNFFQNHNKNNIILLDNSKKKTRFNDLNNIIIIKEFNMEKEINNFIKEEKEKGKEKREKEKKEINDSKLLDSRNFDIFINDNELSKIINYVK